MGYVFASSHLASDINAFQSFTHPYDKSIINDRPRVLNC